MRKSMKQATALTLAAVTALSLTACGGGKADAPAATQAAGESKAEGGASADGEQVELTFSWWGGDSRHEATEKAIEAFMAKYPNITVTPEYGAWTGWEEKQSLNILGGNAADVMQIKLCRPEPVRRCSGSDPVPGGCFGAV